ncbi:MAG: ion transporter [Candidatus Limisoma sp.]
MNKIQDISQRIATNKWFELAIIGIIIINSVLIGVETYTNNATIVLVQQIILYIFTFEIAIRFIAAQNIRIFFTNGWNIFDLTLVIIGYIPETLVENASMMMALRVLRVFRVLRLLRTAKEIKVIITVLIRSFSAMFYNVILFLIFVYLYAIIGVGIFKLPDPNRLTGEDKVRYEQFMEIAPNAPANSPDPFGTLDEAMFTLFRELTGEDWTDLRYNHVTASELGVIKVSPTVINIYHISWFVIAVFLLLNLVTGAIINNYQTVKEENDRKEKEKQK